MINISQGALISAWRKLLGLVKEKNTKLLKAYTLRFKVNRNSSLASSLGLYCSADMAEITFRNEVSVPELLLNLSVPCLCTVYLLQ